ncbi:type I-B CRISPR-associated protein Cas7/Cst2/DevR [candidate division KSB1 bacterium]|nr:type I-B CRISPR-associated protein Cas7/Cst2/DevR [candidate division KSB1 bacterium]
MKVNSITITYLSKVTFASLSGSDSDADNINTIKKITLNDGSELPYVSPQALRHALRNQLNTLGCELSKITPGTGKAPAITKCNPIKYIDDDLFGFMDAKGDTQRTSPIRVESMVALTKYQSDMDFGTNYMGVEKGGNPNIFETEIHSGLYRGSILIELDRVGKGNEKEGFSVNKKVVEVDKEEKIKRLHAFTDAFQNLWSSGRQSRFLADISPKFFAAALMKAKNPIFLEAVNHPINIDSLKTVVDDYSLFIEKHLFAGQKAVIGEVNGDIKTLKEGFDELKQWVRDYYDAKK